MGPPVLLGPRDTDCPRVLGCVAQSGRGTRQSPMYIYIYIYIKREIESITFATIHNSNWMYTM